jgi:pyruvate,water dikinase
MQNLRYIRVISADASDHPSKSGAKAYNLGRLISAGFPVPEGFCVLSGAFDEFLKSAPAIADLRSRLEKFKEPNSEETTLLLSELRNSIESTPLPHEVEQEITSALGKFDKDTYFAVRSSGTAEDMPDASFAGQYDSFLNIREIDNILLKIRSCMASLYSERAWAYRRKNGIPENGISMAVIIQKMIQADFSGVTFTADPVSGDKTKMVTEAVEGLGDALVSGKTNPFRITIDKGGILPENNESGFPVNKILLQSLIEIAGKIEDFFGSPQDIEWTICKDHIFILQSRPITTSLSHQHIKGDIWSSVNVGELMPGVITPMAFSIANESVKGLFFFVAKLLKIDFGTNPFIATAGGRVYANVSVFTRLLTCLPGLGKMELRDSFGGMQARNSGSSPLPDELIDLLPKNKPLTREEKAMRKKASNAALIAMPGIILKLIFNLIFVNENKFLLEMRQKVDEAQHIDVETMTDDELYSFITRTIGGAMEGSNILLQVAGMGMGLSTTLFELCEKWLGDKSGEIANKLLAGAENMESANGAMELWALAEKAHYDEKIRSIIMDGENYLSTIEKMNQTDEGREFIKSWNEFIFRSGHHARGEVNIYIPRWAEEPDYLLDLIRNCIRSMDVHNPAEVRKKRTQERERLLEECFGKLKNPFKKFIFRLVASKSRRGLELRENLKSQWMRTFFPVRKSILETGKRLFRKGIIDNEGDIFFLYLHEMENPEKPDLNTNIKPLIKSRKESFEKNQYLSPAAVIAGEYNPSDFSIVGWENSPLQLLHVPVHFSDDPDHKEYHILKGIAVCPGIVEGSARVILSASDHEQVLPGEILVAPYTDPGWTPYFLTAAALVVDMGGMLSHGSIIAREYGIPAVVNVGPATTLIKTGQKVRVDGKAGKVYIYPVV